MDKIGPWWFGKMQITPGNNTAITKSGWAGKRMRLFWSSLVNKLFVPQCICNILVEFSGKFGHLFSGLFVFNFVFSCFFYPERTRVVVIQGDITDYESVLEASRGTDVVIHTASLVDVWYKVPEPLIYSVNVTGEAWKDQSDNKEKGWGGNTNQQLNFEKHFTTESYLEENLGYIYFGWLPRHFPSTKKWKNSYSSHIHISGLKCGFLLFQSRVILCVQSVVSSLWKDTLFKHQKSQILLNFNSNWLMLLVWNLAVSLSVTWCWSCYSRWVSFVQTRSELLGKPIFFPSTFLEHDESSVTIHWLKLWLNRVGWIIHLGQGLTDHMSL